jgi:hypothetical protein
VDEPPTDHPQVQSGRFTPVDTPAMNAPQAETWPPAKPNDGSFRLVTLADMLPISLVVPVLEAVNEAIEKQGYEAFFKDATGMGVMWVRKRTA